MRQICFGLQHLHTSGIVFIVIYIPAMSCWSITALEGCLFSVTLVCAENSTLKRKMTMVANSFFSDTDIFEPIRPEEARDEASSEFGFASDMFAFGCLMWEIISGEDPKLMRKKDKVQECLG
jgi:serine/threonine protein kinase